LSEQDLLHGSEYWKTILGGNGGRMAWRSAPLNTDSGDYWFAGARLICEGNSVTSAALALKDPSGEPRRLRVIEEGLVSGILKNADDVLDAVRDLVECRDDECGSAAVKSYLAGWICADVVGRCLK
jgi:CO/xanthine dehydrogenase FAD-binding subunit